MALSSAITWEVRGGGHADNGSGFKTGSGGTDRTQSDSPHVTFNGATITATTVGASATITVSGYTVIAGDVGNVVKITGGTNFITGYYEITSVNTGSSTWTFDRTCTSGNGSGMTGRMGGGSVSLNTIKDTFVAGNTIYVTGTTTHSTTCTFSAVNGTRDLPIRIIGYSSTRGDGGYATIQSAANSITLIGTFVGGYSFENLIVEKAGGNSSVDGFLIQQSRNMLINCKGINCTTNFGIQGSCALIKCVSTGGTTGFSLSSSGGVTASFCEAYNASGACFFAEPPSTASHSINYCIAVDAGTYGFHFRENGTMTVQNCVAYSCTSGGYYVENWNGVIYYLTLINCIASENGGYGFSGVSSGATNRTRTINCATYSNTSGATTNTLNEGIITLTADPFVTKTPGSGTGDYDLNNTAGGGALLRQLGYPSTMAYYTATTPLLNVGAGGFAASAGGTTTNVIVQRKVKVR